MPKAPRQWPYRVPQNDWISRLTNLRARYGDKLLATKLGLSTKTEGKTFRRYVTGQSIPTSHIYEQVNYFWRNIKGYKFDRFIREFFRWAKQSYPHMVISEESRKNVAKFKRMTNAFSLDDLVSQHGTVRDQGIETSSGNPIQFTNSQECAILILYAHHPDIRTPEAKVWITNLLFPPSMSEKNRSATVLIRFANLYDQIMKYGYNTFYCFVIGSMTQKRSKKAKKK